MEIKQEIDKSAPKKSRKKQKDTVEPVKSATNEPCAEGVEVKKTKTSPTKKTSIEVPLVRPEKKKELELFWRSISVDNIHLLTDEDYEAYRRWVYKKKEANKVS